MKKKFLMFVILCGLICLANPAFAEEVTSIDETTNPTQASNTTDDQMGMLCTAECWWDLSTNKKIPFSVLSDIPFEYGTFEINFTKKYIVFGAAYQFSDGWQFKGITFEGKAYQPGDRAYYTGNNPGEIHYNYEPYETYVKINYSGLPADVVKDLPTKLNEPIIGETIMLMPAAPEVPGYTASTEVKMNGVLYGYSVNVGDLTTFFPGGLSDSVTYSYLPNLSSEKLLVNYIDTAGNQLAEVETLEGTIGEKYETAPKVFDGYRLIETIGESSGIFEQGQKHITYKYEKISVLPPYIDYKENTIVLVTDLERDLEIVQNCNVNLMTVIDNHMSITLAGTTKNLDLINKTVKVTKRIETANGNIYYVISESGKDYVILSSVFRNINPEYDFSIPENLGHYSNISLDYAGNYLSSVNDVAKTVTLVNNFNVYDVLKTGGDKSVSAKSGTSSGLNLLNKRFEITKEYTTSGGSKFYNIIVDGYNYFINAVAFVVESI